MTILETASDTEVVRHDPLAIETSEQDDRIDRIELVDRIARETLGLHGV